PAGPVAADDDAPVAPVLPAGFVLVDYPTGQAPYDLTNFAWLDDGSLITAGKGGTVTFVPAGGTPRVVATVPDVRSTGDHGMLGFAPAHDYATTGHVFLTYDKGDAAGEGVGTVEEWTMSPPASPTSFTRTRTVLDGSTTSPPLAERTDVHSIDSVVVAPDGTLFVSVGDDALNNGDPAAYRAQDLDQPYGKILHLTTTGLGVPSNPYYAAGDPGSWRSRVYASGFRNPFRISLDPRSGLLNVGDVGWRSTEEVDTIGPGANAGWPCYEGRARTSFAPAPVCQTLYAEGSAQLPIWTYPHRGPGAAVVGGTLYQGSSYPAAYAGTWFLGDYASQQLWTMTTDLAGRMTRAPETGGFATSAGAPVAFHPGPNGDVTYADLASGSVRRLVWSPGDRAPVASFTTATDASTLTASFSAADSYDLDGDALTYAWDFGDGSTDTGRTVQHTFSSGDPVTVRLTVTDPLGASGTSTTTVHPANHSPQLTLTQPGPVTYAVGDRVRLSATATDPEDGSLPVSWTTSLRHCPFAGSCHRHPGVTVRGPAYDQPFTDHGSDTVMVVTARAVDSSGAVASTTYVASPRLHRVAVDSPVAVTVNGVTTSSAEVVAGSQVQLSAPRSSSYWHFTRWSDRGAPTHGFTMPDADTTRTATYTTAIASRYAALGGSRSYLGQPTGAEYDVTGGRARNYTGGRLFWGPTSGAHSLRGPLLSAYLASGGPATGGLPTSDVVTVRGGARAHFTGSRSIMWSARTGAHVVRGVIRSRYAALGWQRSCLGFPTGEQHSVTRGLRQWFTGGSLTWVRRTGRVSAAC
ncbi:MAG: Glucose/sorbosone dehydrogenase, partial [Marmoricola sp.]|nr:Glucose/sorbosone dehydrogenase [Marmoricola sp.]